MATTPGEAKGLEFDAVVLVEPALIVQEAGGLVGDLYVAMTRSTQTLRVVTTGELPTGLEPRPSGVGPGLFQNPSAEPVSCTLP